MVSWEQYTPLVYDVGSFSVRAGWAGHDQPKIVEAAYMGRKKGDIDPIPLRFLSNRKYDGVEPHRIVNRENDEWVIDKDLFRVCTDTLLYSQRGLQGNPLERGVIATCPSGADKEYKKVFYEHFMESVEVPMFFLGDTSVLSMYASGRVSGIHVDIGAACTTVAVVDRGVTTMVNEYHVAGDYIDNYISSRVEIPTSASYGTEYTPEFAQQVRLALAREIKHSACKCNHHALLPTTPHRGTTRTRQGKTIASSHITTPVVPFKLPDGTEVDVGAVAEYAAELLFTETSEGYPGLTQSILETTCGDDDVELPAEPFVLLTGGSAHFHGLHTRLVSELTQIEEFKQAHVFPFTQWTHRQHAGYVGASIVASLSSFASLWVTPASYKESGIDRLVLAK